MKNIIIIGARGYKSNYGGWETFVTNLIENYQEKNVKFHVPELTTNKKQKKQIIEKEHVSCLQVYSPNLGFFTMFIYAISALRQMKKYIQKNHLDNVIVYILGCRIGPFYPFLIRFLKKQGIKIYLNPDGLEWTREKWAWWIKQCFKISEYCMIKHSDGIVCDSKAIQNYVQNRYQKFKKQTFFIPYGAYLDQRDCKTEKVKQLYKKYQVTENNYYLIVGRFVPENNYETMIKEFISSNTKKDLVIISNVENNKFYRQLREKTKFDCDKRVKFIGAVYDKDTLVYFRKNAYAYIHGHSAGGTNPSLLEALATTKINILFHAVYNVEVGMMSCLYFSKKVGDLKNLIEKVETFDKKTIEKYEKLSLDRIKKEYTWKLIVEAYKNIW